MLRTLSVCLLAAPAAAQFGRRNRQQQAQAEGQLSDVDLAMAGWEQLAKNPGKMAEVMEGLKVSAQRVWPARLLATSNDLASGRPPTPVVRR